MDGTSQSGDFVFGRTIRPRQSGPTFLLPQFLFQINWADSGPGFSWPESYHACYVPTFGCYVVTASADSKDAYGYEDIALGWFAEDVPVKSGARDTIIRRWKSYLDFDHPGWCDFLRAGRVTEAEAYEWKASIWEADASNTETPVARMSTPRPPNKYPSYVEPPPRSNVPVRITLLIATPRASR